MKTNPLKTGFLFAAIGWLAMNSGICAIVTDVDDWYAYYSSDRGREIVNGNTSSPTYYFAAPANNPRAINFVWSYFDPITLNDGESLTLSTRIRVDFATASSGQFQFTSFGLYYTEPSNQATIASFGSDRYVSTLPGTETSGWSGFFLRSDKSSVLRRNPGDTNIYPSTTGATDGALMSNVFANPTFLDNTDIALTLEFARDANDLLVSGFFGSDSFSGVWLNAFTGNYTDVFNTFGFYTATLSPVSNLTSVTFDNTTITAVPEPSVAALLAGAVAVFAILRRRNGWTN